MQRQDVIYTRFSTDMQRDESCEDQEREIRKGLAQKGIDATHFEVIYDRAASGTKNNRAQFDQLRERIQRGEIGSLAVDDQARFSRADNAFSFITDLVYSGGRFISTGEGIDTKQEGWELRVKVMELHNSTTIRELGRRVRRGQLGRVLDDGSAGDFPFGYESYYLDPNWAEASRRGPKPKKGVRILEPEARWVRQVFSWFADEGKAIGWIARELTRLQVDKRHRATTPGWHHQQVHRMLSNPKYIGEWPWGTTRTIRSSEGKTKQVAVPLEQQIKRQRSGLRIVDQVTWEKAQHRLTELKDRYGRQQGQKIRGPKPHYSELYPQSLLGGLLFCKLCGSRLWVQCGGGGNYMGCPNHRKGTCSMANRVPVKRAEEAILKYVSDLLNSWPEWLQAATTSLRVAAAALTSKIPEDLRADEDRRSLLKKQIGNLVDVLANGSTDSPALRERLAATEQELDRLEARIEQRRRAQEGCCALPDDAWIQAQLIESSSLLRDDPGRTSLLLRRMLGRVTAEAVIAPGKSRGYTRLHVRVAAIPLLQEVLGGQLPEIILSAVQLTGSESETEISLDLGEPTRCDLLGAEIAQMRDRGITWDEICSRTGLGMRSAYCAWKRWTDGQAAEQSRRA